MQILVDTREQDPLRFRKSPNVKGTVVRKLSVGDYSFECDGVSFEERIAFERKSASDLFGTLGSGMKRFKKEIERAAGMDYFCIIVEEPFTNILEKKWDGAHRTKMKGHTIVKTLNTLKFKYGVNFVFTQNREESIKYIRETFKSYRDHFERGTFSPHNYMVYGYPYMVHVGGTVNGQDGNY